MHNQKNNKFTEPIDIGLPKTGYTPMDTVAMEAAMFKKMGQKSNKRSLILKIAIIALSLIIFIIPAIAIIYLGISIILDKSTEIASFFIMLISVLFGFSWFIIGARIIYPNIRK